MLHHWLPAARYMNSADQVSDIASTSASHLDNEPFFDGMGRMLDEYVVLILYGQ